MTVIERQALGQPSGKHFDHYCDIVELLITGQSETASIFNIRNETGEEKEYNCIDDTPYQYSPSFVAISSKTVCRETIARKKEIETSLKRIQTLS